MKKKKTVSQTKKLADKWFSLYVRWRDSDKGICECITCGVKKPVEQMQCGHFMSRRFNATRFEEENCNAQCIGCNMFKQGEQYKYGRALEDKYGKGTAERLHKMAQEFKKWTIPELEEIIHDSKEQVAFYRSLS